MNSKSGIRPLLATTERYMPTARGLLLPDLWLADWGSKYGLLNDGFRDIQLYYQKDTGLIVMFGYRDYLELDGYRVRWANFPAHNDGLIGCRIL